MNYLLRVFVYGVYGCSLYSIILYKCIIINNGYWKVWRRKKAADNRRGCRVYIE